MKAAASVPTVRCPRCSDPMTRPHNNQPRQYADTPAGPGCTGCAALPDRGPAGITRTRQETR